MSLVHDLAFAAFALAFAIVHVALVITAAATDRLRRRV